LGSVLGGSELVLYSFQGAPSPAIGAGRVHITSNNDGHLRVPDLTHQFLQFQAAVLRIRPVFEVSSHNPNRVFWKVRHVKIDNEIGSAASPDFAAEFFAHQNGRGTLAFLGLRDALFAAVP
jgi:hypothetical protein